MSDCTLIPNITLFDTKDETVAMNEDDSLMQAIANGSESAATQLFEKWKLPLISFLYRSTGSREDAEDIAVRTLSKVYSAADRYSSQSKFSSYIFSIARRLLISEHRKKSCRPLTTVPPDDLHYLSPINTERETSLNELESTLMMALEKIPEKYRTPLLLLKQQDLNYSEIAEMLDVTENTLRTLLFRGRKKLKEEMENLL